MADAPLLRAPVLVLPRRVNAVVRALVEDAASPATAPDGTVLGRVRQEPFPRAPIARALFLAVSILVNNPQTGRDPTFAAEDADGSPVLRLARLESRRACQRRDADRDRIARRRGEVQRRTEIPTESLPLRTLLAGFACSMVMPEWVNRPPLPPRGG